MCLERADLFDEIWYQIFGFLPVDARKNVRLTCRRFYELCNDIRLLKDEEIVINGDIHRTNPLLQLSSSHRKLWNIKLNRVHITHSIRSFFEKQEGHIHSLTLYKCKFAPGSLKTIVERCQTIRSLVLVLSYCDEDQYYRYVFDDFEALGNNSFTCDQVADLTLKIDRNGCISNRIFLQMFLLFPNVRRVDLEFEVGEKFNQLNGTCGHVMSDANFNFSSIYNRIMAVRNQLEKLRLHFTSYRHSSGLSINTLNKITEIEMKNLKELSLNWITSSTVFATNPFHGFESLTQFDCDFGYNSTAQVSPLLKLLLSTVTRLRSLTLRAFYFRLSKQCFEALVASKLVALNIETIQAADFDLSPLELAPNYTLQHLNIDAEHRDLFILFPTYFRRLQHIKFPEVHHGILHNILEQQTNLRSLKLYNGNEYHDWYPDCPFIEYDTFQQYLQKADLSQCRHFRHLTYLDIIEDKLCLTNFLLSEFEFPKLKSLSVSVMLERKENEQLWHIIQHMHQLEYLKLKLQFAMSTRQWMALFCALTKLRHIYVQDMAKPFDAPEYLHFFNVRSTLRTVIHNSTKYFYDITTNTVEHTRDTFDSSRRRLHPFACEGIPHHYYYDNKCP